MNRTAANGLDRIRFVALAGSAGAPEVLRTVLSGLSPCFALPVVVVVHMHPSDQGLLAANLGRISPIPVVEAQDKMLVRPGRIHVAPADYHLLVERSGALALSVDEPVRWSRPSIDVFLGSAAVAWGPRLLAVLLSGANEDGAAGLAAVSRAGGLAVAQAPETADFPRMPAAGMAAAGLAGGLAPGQIRDLLQGLQGS